MSTGATCTSLRKLFKTRERSHYLVKEKVPGSECGIGAPPQSDELTCRVVAVRERGRSRSHEDDHDNDCGRSSISSSGSEKFGV